jgi:hypothetical protein
MAARAHTSRGGRERGQALAEFAVILPVFALLVFGLLEAGRMVHADSALAQAAREGARVAAAEAGWVGLPGAGCVSDGSAIDASNPGAHVCPADVAALRSHVDAAAGRMIVAVGAIDDLYLSCNAGDGTDPAPEGEWTDGVDGAGNGCTDGSGNAMGAAGDLVSVRVVYTYEPFVPVIASIIGSLEMSGSATMVIN